MHPDGPPVVVIRTVFRGRVWTAVPHYPIEDSPEHVVAAVLQGGALPDVGSSCPRGHVCSTGKWPVVGRDDMAHESGAVGLAARRHSARR